MFEKINSHQLHLHLLNGQVANINVGELKQFLRSRNTLILIAIVPVLISLANPRLFPTTPGISTRLFICSICAVLYTILLPYWIYGCHRLWRRTFTIPIPHPIYSIPFSVGLTAVAISIPTAPFELVTPRASSQDFIGFLRNSVFVLLIEHAAVVLLMPLFKSQVAETVSPRGPTEIPDEEPCERFVKLGSQFIPVDAISQVQSSKHHLIVFTGDQERILRSSMSHFLKQVTELDGIQSHRSHWVSSDEALELAGNTIRTKSGKDIPVSRGRRETVKEWLQRQGKPF